MSILEKTKKQIEEMYLKYDIDTGLIRQFWTPNYHSNLKPGEYCKLADNLEYALAIFACGCEKYYKVANDILRKVISCQSTDEATYGLWSYFYEESLEEMVAPDWNYADFSAIPMLNILKDYADKLEDGMYELIGKSCLDACRAILKRDLTITYTNPAIMDVYVTIVCGELFDRRDLVDYGTKKLNKIYYHVMDAQTFDEYNCPGYSLLIANIFSIMLRHIENVDIQKKVNVLNNIVWTMLGKHYHNKTGEFAGPNLRQYGNFISARELSVYRRAIGLDILSENEVRYDLMDVVYDVKCPAELKHLFLEDKSVDSKVLISRGRNFPWFDQPIVDTQYMTEDYCLGSFSLMDGWNQHRTVVAYMGDRDKKCCIRMRVLHDDYDFCSAFIGTVQEKGAAISVVNFHTNRGDTHVDLDPVKNATIKAKDLRIRYQIEANTDGVIEDVASNEFENGCELNVLGVMVKVAFSFAQMSGETPYFEVKKEGREIFVDMVLYNGAEKEINFNELDSAISVSYICVGENEEIIPELEQDDKYLSVTARLNKKNIKIKAVFRPQEQIPSVMAFELFEDGERLECIAEKNL